ncbi:MAG: hypothetical protein JOZ78_07195 [Chroococcidiopsidaceae cyanobacterium CP_BM_ER_R8_30]|nr:hypothetical protein [Chroococcidiopsidaceae cyanobacterium CP_BM_ER_R8_30]
MKAQLQRTPVAIIGMAAIFPRARNLQEYWHNVLRQVDCITGLYPAQLDTISHHIASKVLDNTYYQREGFIPETNFNSSNINDINHVSPLMALIVAKEAMVDAGYGESWRFNRERTGIILGMVARQATMSRTDRRHYSRTEKALRSASIFDEKTLINAGTASLATLKREENVPSNMLAKGVIRQIAHWLDLGGAKCVIDAACTSSLGALTIALKELTEYRRDIILAGGVDIDAVNYGSGGCLQENVDSSRSTKMFFSKTSAQFENQNVRPFDADADGMVLTDGIGMIVLKRLEDAERDGDRIYAVIKGIGTSSADRYRSIYAPPRLEGQIGVLQRAYRNAGLSPLSVGLLEAHGTGTKTGDQIEFTALKAVFGRHNSKTQHIALGTVKSQIGNTKAAAGAASVIKTALALHHKVLPPTINITRPHPKLNVETSPFYLNTETRPWINPQGAPPRRAGVSSFGFGGTSYHIILEEYKSEPHKAHRLHCTPQSVLLFASTPVQLLAQCENLLLKLQSADGEQHYAELIDACKSLEISSTDARIGFVCDSLSDAYNLLESSVNCLEDNLLAPVWHHPRGIYYRSSSITPHCKVVALFSGEGSQYLEMGQELAINFSDLRQVFSYVDTLFGQHGLQPLSRIVFPPPTFDTLQRYTQAAVLMCPEYAQLAVGAFSVGLYKILQQVGFYPDFVVGQGCGELTALWAARVLRDDDYFFLVRSRGLATPDDQRVAARIPPEQVGKAFLKAVEAVGFSKPQIPVYSNVTGNCDAAEPKAIQELLKEHLNRSLLSRQAIENIYAAGGYCFVEFGPRNTLTNLVKAVLGQQPHIAIALNPTRQQSSDRSLREAVVNLRVAGLPLKNLESQ